MLTVERIKTLLVYDPESGIFTWIKPTSNRVKPGYVCKPSTRGYVSIKIDGVQYPAQRLAWLYMTGKWPIGEVDHKNTIPSNNRWGNLRDVPHALNMQNIIAAHADSANLLGVGRTRSGRFMAKICISGRQIYLGVFSTPMDAHVAYRKAKRMLHPASTL